MKQLFFLFFLIIPIILKAQSNYVIQGKIIDKITQKGIPYVNMGIIDKPIGYVTSETGDFTLKIPFLVSTDSIQTVYLGYESCKISLKEMLGKFNTIELTATTDDLTEIKLNTTYTVFDLIQEALDKVKENYYEEKPINLITYLSTTEYSQTENKVTRELESYFTIYRPKINSSALAKIKIDKARKKACFACSFLKTWFFSGLLDWVEKDMLFFALKKSNFKKYTYKMTGIELINNMPNYRILITDKEKGFLVNNYAEIFIDTTSLAFTKFTRQKNCEYSKDTGTPLYLLMYKQLHQKYEVNYQKINDKWYLHKVDFYTKIMEKDPRDTLQIYTQYKVTDIIRENIQNLNPLECMHEKTIIEDKAMHWDDPAWLENKKTKKIKPPKNKK